MNVITYQKQLVVLGLGDADKVDDALVLQLLHRASLLQEVGLVVDRRLVENLKA